MTAAAQEFDPTGRDRHEPGAKVDAGKLDLTLVPPELEEAVCRVLEFGAKKYSRDGWRTVPDAARRYFAALERHLKAFKRGEDFDRDSGLHHLDHAACNLAFLLHFYAAGHDIGAWRYHGARTAREAKRADDAAAHIAFHAAGAK
jgi:hypothetical protein